MRRSVLIALLLMLATAASVAAHDLFLKLESYFVRPESGVRIHVLNGTFSKSENAVARDRVRDLSLAGPLGISKVDTSSWSDRGDTSVLAIQIGAAGTYVVGASIHSRELRLEAKDFNAYLASDGVPDVLAARRQKGELDKPARERYSKHVKAVLQAGGRRTDAFATELGYPAELIPLENPYTLKVGQTLRVRALVEGTPTARQLVVAGGRTARGARIAPASVRTDSAGVARIRLRSPGLWYVKFIHMAPPQADTTIDYESKWATLTFQVR
jgi:uncharacterized GH25 family protein